jgi:hypothetical protein
VGEIPRTIFASRFFDGMPMLDYLVIVVAFAIVCGATLLFMKVTG